MMMFFSITLLWMTLILALLYCSSPANAYASWLQCYIELDEEEVVMHHPMIPPQEAKHEAFLQVQPYGSLSSSSSKWITADEYTLGAGVRASKDEDIFVNTLKVRLQVPDHLEMMNEDVQFVVEIVKGHSSDDDDSASFIDLGVQCDGSRAFSRRHDEHVVLQINSTTTNSNDNVVELMAGWAAGYEAVTLTRVMTLKRSPVGGGSTIEGEVEL